MKTLHLLPLLLLTACSANRSPILVMRPPEPPSALDENAVRYPEVLRAYHVGRYPDPNSDSLLHGESVVWRVESGARWNFHPSPQEGSTLALPPIPRDSAFAPLPVNDAILAEINAQKAASTRIMAQAEALSAAVAQFQGTFQAAKKNLQETAALRVTLFDLKTRLDALEAASRPVSLPASQTSEPTNVFGP